jgi:class 3 adenylate cyclase/tetratricopeptide (TPR) repeat protein
VSDLPAQPTIDELLDRAVRAINRGDRATADALAGQVLAVDRANPDAEELLAAPADSGEIRRLTMLFADLVDSTALSTRVEPEVYRTVVGRYRDEVIGIVNRYEGHLGSTKGDGLFAVFGHPQPHENDAHRAVQAGLDVTREVAVLSKRVRRRFGFDIDVRVGIHRGLVYLDIAQDDVYGMGANLAARICGLADPGTVAVSAAIERVVRVQFELEARPAKPVKGFDEPIVHYRVVGERDVARLARGPLIGREHELAFLEDSWRQAEAGTLRTPGVVLRGEGGIGKSRLARAAVDMAKQSDAKVLDLFGSPFHTEVGLRPVRRLLERRCGIGRDSDPAVRLERLRAEVESCALDPDEVVPLMAPVLGVGPESGYQPTTANAGKLYDQIVSAVTDYLRASLGTGPGLVLIEDIHWFDEDTAEVVRGLLSGDSGRLLVVITGRQLPPLPGTETFDLKPLSDSQTDELILALSPQMKPSARRTVRERCDGIPLYIEEVVAKLKGQASDSANSAEVPDTLYETLVARLRSSRDTLLVVETAALIGSHFDKSLLSYVLELNEREIDALLEELNHDRVFRPVGKHSWRFHHELLREVAAELSPPSVRRRLHNLIADALVATAADGAPDWPLVAHHYENAERFDEAASALQQASTNARQRGALGEARGHLTRALENTERLAPSQARDRREIAVRLERGFLTSTATGHASTEAAAEFERCLQLIGDEPTPELFATFSALWSYYGAVGDLRRATQLVEALRMTLGAMPDWYRVANDASRGALAVFRGQYHTARTTLEAAAVELDHLGSTEIEGAWYAPNDPLAAMYAYVALTRFIQGDLAGAETAFAQMERRCEKLRFPHGAFTLCYGRAMETWTRIEAGQFDCAAGLIEEVAHRGELHGFDEWVGIAACNQASLAARIALASGAAEPTTLRGHIENMTAVVEAWRAIGRKAFLGGYDATLAALLTAAGMNGAARERVDLALQMADETEWHMYDAELLRTRAHTYDEPDARHAGLLAAIELAQTQGAPIFELRAAADDFELVGEPAHAALTEALSRFPPDQEWPELARARALLG